MVADNLVLHSVRAAFANFFDQAMEVEAFLEACKTILT